MPDLISTRFDRMVQNSELEACISFLEEGLHALQLTPYHKVVGRNFLSQTDELAEWIATFSRKAADANVGLAAYYLEMNGFTINPDEWHCHLFGYKTAGNTWNLEWLSDWDAENNDRFVLCGMEDVQGAYANVFGDDSQPLSVKLAEEIAEFLVTARFMQLVAAAHQKAKSIFPPLAGIPVLSTAHDWDTVYQTK